jgi:hypothetical protein
MRYAAVVPAVLVLLVPAGAASAQTRNLPGGYEVNEPERTRYFELGNGIMGGAIQASIPNAKGIDWKSMMGGAAYAMRYSPTGGPDCNPKKVEGLIEFFSLHATSDSRMAVNMAAKVGVAYITGTVTRYVPARDFCTSKRYTKAETAPGYIYMPFAAQGWSLRNFMANALAPEGAPAASAGGRPLTSRVVGTISGPNLMARLGGYASVEMLGQSQALGEGPGAEATVAVLDQYAGAGPAAEALKNVPGAVPGKNSEGWIQLNLSDKPAASIGGSNTPFIYVHIRALHTGKEIPAGKEYEALQHAVRTSGEVLYDPAFPNDPRRKP